MNGACQSPTGNVRRHWHLQREPESIVVGGTTFDYPFAHCDCRWMSRLAESSCSILHADSATFRFDDARSLAILHAECELSIMRLHFDSAKPTPSVAKVHFDFQEARGIAPRRLTIGSDRFLAGGQSEERLPVVLEFAT